MSIIKRLNKLENTKRKTITTKRKIKSLGRMSLD
jgi:hypothetical protein